MTNLPEAVPEKLLDLDLQLCFPLYATTRAVTAAYGKILAPVGLTYPQYLVMLTLWGDDSGRSVGELGERLRLDSGTLSPLLKRLEAVGLVTRTRSADDERRVQIELTTAGRELRAQLAHVPLAIAEAMGLDGPAYSDLQRHLAIILANLDDWRVQN